MVTQSNYSVSLLAIALPLFFILDEFFHGLSQFLHRGNTSRASNAYMPRRLRAESDDKIKPDTSGLAQKNDKQRDNWFYLSESYHVITERWLS